MDLMIVVLVTSASTTILVAWLYVCFGGDW